MRSKPGRAVLKRFLRSVSSGATQFLIPPLCLASNCSLKRWGELPLCRSCFRKLIAPGMSVSGKKVQPVLDQSTFPDFVYLGHLFSLNREFKELLYGLKYRGLKRNGKFLAGFIRFHPDLVRIIGSYDALVPVPLHPLKKRERGYNQSQVIAESVSLRTGVPVGCGYLKRLRYTGTQTRLGRGRRLKNIASSIAAGPNKKFKKQKLLLVDDVLTTGATLTSCAKALKKVGVAEVGALTLAQALKTPDARDFRAELEMAGSFVF